MQEFSNSVYYYVSSNYVNTGNISAFDLDWTLIRPHKGVFPLIRKELKHHVINHDIINSKLLDDYDIKLLPYRIDYLDRLQKAGYSIAIFTNQKVSKRNTIESKLSRLNVFIKYLEYYGINVVVFMSTASDKNRKPEIGMWKKFTGLFQINTAFYSGDAAGRYTDFSMSDIQFAMNIGIDFFLPEQLFSFYIPNISYENNIYVLFGSKAANDFMNTYANKYLYQFEVNPSTIAKHKSYVIITNSLNPAVYAQNNYDIEYIYFTGHDSRYNNKIINSYMSLVILPKTYNEVDNVMFV